MTAPGSGNGRHVWRTVAGVLAAGSALLGFVMLGNQQGTIAQRVGTVEHRLAEEIPRALIQHDAIEARTDQKLAQQRELLLVELRAINARLERIERKLP